MMSAWVVGWLGPGVSRRKSRARGTGMAASGHGPHDPCRSLDKKLAERACHWKGPHEGLGVALLRGKPLGPGILGPLGLANTETQLTTRR